MNDAISAGAKGIAITVPDQTIGPAIAKAAKDAGVVLIATDDGIKDEAGNPVPFVGFDGKDMGKKVGDAAAKLLTDSGWLKDSAKKVGVLSIEVQTLSVCNDRTDNEKAAAKAAGVPDGADLPGAVHRRGVVLAGCGRPDHHREPGHHELGRLRLQRRGRPGALNALATAGVKTDNIIGVGLGSYEACKPWAAGQPSGFKAGLFISGLDVGKTAATVLNDAVVNGKAPAAVSYAPTSIVDATNYKTVMDPISLANCSAGGAKAPAGGQKPLFVVINKSADQQYFIDLQNSFVAAAGEAGRGRQEVRRQAGPEPGREPGERRDFGRRQGHRHHRAGSDDRAGHRQSGEGCGRGADRDRRRHQGRGRQPGAVRGLRRQGHGQEGRRCGGEAADRQRLAEGLGQEGRRPVDRGPDPLGLQRPHRQREGRIQGGRRAGRAQIFPVPYTGEALSSQDAAGPIITANPDITNWVVFGCNDEGVLGDVECAGDRGCEDRRHHRRGPGLVRGVQAVGRRPAVRLQGGPVHLRPGRGQHRGDGAVRCGRQRQGAGRPCSYAPTSIVDATNYKTVMDPISLANCAK